MEYHFLDLHGLSDSERCHLTDLLRSDSNIAALKLPWVSTENNSNVNSVPVTEITAEIQTSWYNAMAHSYQQQMMTPMCNEWQASNMYSVSTNGHIQPFMPGMAYSHPEYNIGTEVHEVNYSRDNSRRNGRGKSIRRDCYNRTLNHANEMQPGYVADQGHFHPQIPVMYIYPDHSVPPQQHPVAGQIYYQPTIYSSTALHQPHPNAHSYTHSTYPAHHQVPDNRFVRQPQPIPSQPNQEDIKPPSIKSQDRHIQQSTCSSAEVAHQQMNQNDIKLAESNITVTESGNELKSCAENTAENTAKEEYVATNGEIKSSVNKTEDQNIKPMINENCKITEISPININSDAEMKPNGEKKNEIASSLNTTIAKTASKPASKEGEIEVRVEETVATTNDERQIIIKTSDDFSNTSSGPTPVSIAETPSTAVRSWASLLKNDCADTKTSSAPKITASVNVVHQNGLPKSIQKESIPNSGNGNQNNPSDTSNAANDYKTLQNGVLENFYDDPNLFRMGEFLLHYQMDKQTVSLLPRGLTNRSNYCYINSILQALLACPLFYNLLKALPHPNNYGKLNKHSTTPLIDNMVRFIREFTPLSDTARLPRKDRAYKRGEDTVIENGVALEPSYVYTMLKYTSAAGVFSVEGRQEDAEEFLSCLLNGINDEMLELMKIVNNEQNTAASVENNTNHNHDEEEWKVIGPKNKGSITRCTELERTPLSDIFRGQLRSRVSRAGEQPTDNVQPFFTLQLDIEKAESVKHALEILVGKDQLEGMTCSKTKKQIEAWKQVTLEELPIILILHLKWFVYKFNVCSKILKSVEFPIDLKIDGKILSPNTAKKLTPKQKQYKLFAVTYHDGKEASKGHYVTDAFHVGYGGWVRYDDSSAKGVSEFNVLKPAPPRVPYLLYYRRCDTIGNNQTNNRPR